jgi:AcrR family transcriptional regulator
MAPATRVRLIEVAERLFAERGIAAVSLREVGRTAGQGNTAAVLYHFGSKQGLVDAIFEHRMRPIDGRRLARLARLEREGRSRDLRALVEALVLPLAEALAARSSYVRFLAQALADPAQGQLISVGLEALEGVRRFLTRAEDCLAGLPGGLRRQRLRHAGTLLVHALAQHERDLETRRRGSPSVPVLVADLVDVLTAVLAAPVSAGTTRELRATLRRRA